VNRQGVNVEQERANRISFHELDQNGNPLDSETATPVMDSSGREGRNSTRPSINPFVIILWVLVGIMVGGGVWIHMDMMSPGGGAFGPDGPVTESPLIVVLRNFTPFAVLAGLQGIIGLLFWHAVQWQRTRQ
jgi:hypothetical protein